MVYGRIGFVLLVPFTLECAYLEKLPWNSRLIPPLLYDEEILLVVWSSRLLAVQIQGVGYGFTRR